MIEGMEEKGVDHVEVLDTYIRAYNKILENRPSDMTFGLHLCRGNFKGGMHFSEGGYDRIAIKLFNEINVDCYYVRHPKFILVRVVELVSNLAARVRYGSSGHIRTAEASPEK